MVVKFSTGKKTGRWPNQDCDERNDKQCWRWFPKDQLIEETYELHEDYGYITYSDNCLNYYQPRYNLITREEMFKFTHFSIYNTLNIYDPILVSDPFILEEFDLSSPFIITPNQYYFERRHNYLVTQFDIEFVETTDCAYCLILAEDLNTCENSQWECYVGNIGYLEPQEFPLGILSFEENQNFVIDFYYNLQGTTGINILNNLRSTNVFNLRREITITQTDVLDILSSNTIIINPGLYFIDYDNEKLRINFGNINF